MMITELCFAIIFIYCVNVNLGNDIFSKFHQKDYKVEFQRSELVSYDKSIFNIFDVKTYKYNRTLPVVNITLNSKKTMSTELEMVLQAYKFLSNEYRMVYGLRFDVNWCRCLKENLAGLQTALECGNLTSCQIIQDTTYRACNIHPDESRLPPFVPNGDYKFQIEFVYHDKAIATFAVFAKIYRPIPIPRKH